MSQKTELDPHTVTRPADASDKKMFRGSFAISLFVHGTILLLVGGIIIGPKMMKNPPRIIPVDLPQTVLPEPPKEPTVDDPKQPEGGDGSPFNADPSDNSPQSPIKEPGLDVIATDNSVNNSAPRVSVGSGASILAGAFSRGGKPGGNGDGFGPDSGILRKTVFKPFGTTEQTDNSLVGKIYDFKQSREKKPLAANSGEALKEIVQKNFSSGSLSKYFSPTNILYSTHIYIPTISSEEGPKAFGVEKTIAPVDFMVHYRASIAAPRDMTFRFAGYGDDWLLVAIDKKIVLDGSLQTSIGWSKISSKTLFLWNPPPEPHQAYKLAYGNWLEWKANEYKTIDIIICESGGNVSSYDLSIQEKDQKYEESDRGLILPVFRVANVQPEKAANFFPMKEGGPIFNARHIK